MKIPLRWKVLTCQSSGRGHVVSVDERVWLDEECSWPSDLADYVADALNAYGAFLQAVRDGEVQVLPHDKDHEPHARMANAILAHKANVWYTDTNDPRPDSEDTTESEEDR